MDSPTDGDGHGEHASVRARVAEAFARSHRDPAGSTQRRDGGTSDVVLGNADIDPVGMTRTLTARGRPLLSPRSVH
jgi:hypothetical protein